MTKKQQPLAIGIALFVFIILTAMATAITPTNPPVGDTDYAELKTETTTEGSGDRMVQAGDTIRVHYVGTLKDGTQFDSSRDRGEPFEFTVGTGSVIAGWEQGVVGMKQGEVRILEIPSSLGYGEMGAGSDIPPGAGLHFEVELVEFVN